MNSLIEALFIFLTTFLTLVLTILIKIINKNLKNNNFNALDSIIESAVISVFQTYLKDLNDKNCFTDECKKEALEKSKKIIKSMVNDELKKYINNNYENFDFYLDIKIEALIFKLKEKKHIL